MEVSVIVKVAIPIDVENIDDSVVVIVDVFPVEYTVSIPVVELREGGASRLTSWIWVDRVWIGRGWTVPCDNVSCFVEREAVVLVVDVIVIEVVFEVRCISAHQNVSKIVRAGCSTKFWI